MTVEELIALLQKFPKNSLVACVYLCCSDYVLLEPGDITYHDKEVEGPYGHRHRYVLRNGKIMEYNEKTWDPAETPHFVSVVAFPGN
jgi:hypothetical protein